MAARKKDGEKKPKRRTAAEVLNGKKSGAGQASDAKVKQDAAQSGFEEVKGEAVDEAGEAVNENKVEGESAKDKASSKKDTENKSKLNEYEAAMVELAAAKTLAADRQDRYMRLQAEWDNFRKRTAAERKAMRERACEDLVTDILPVLDDLDRAIAHAKETGDGGSLTDGVEAIENKLITALNKHKVSEIEAEGLPLDLDKHQAVGTQEDASVPEETVLNVFQKGYMIGEKVLRPAMVITSVGGPARKKEED